MLRPKQTRSYLSVTILVGMFALVVGCSGKPDEGTTKPSNQEKSAGRNDSSQGVWTPNPDFVKVLTKKETFGTYSILLPNDFTSNAQPSLLPSLQSFSWKGPSREGGPPSIFVVTIFSNPKAVADATKNMRQFLVNYSAGLTDESGVNIARREATETGALDGIAFSRFRWTGTAKNQQTAQGFAYGGIDGNKLITVVTFSVGGDGEATNKLLESIVATLKRQ